MRSDFYAKGIGAVLQLDGSFKLTQLRPALTDTQVAALLTYFNSENYLTPVVFVNGQFWANGQIVSTTRGASAIPEYNLTGAVLDPSQNSNVMVIDRFDNGGIAQYVNQSGQIVTVAENTRYTENMLNNYGTEWVNSDGVLEGGMTFGATLQAFGDWIGLDGTFGLDGGFPPDDEGSAAAGNGAGGAGGETPVRSNDDHDGPKGTQNSSGTPVNIWTDHPKTGPKVVTDGGIKNLHPILLDLDGNGIQLTDLTRSTVFMEGEQGLKHRSAWAGAGDGVLFYDTEAAGQTGYNEISDIREYVFTEWDPTAKNDLAALRARFDTNGDGKLMGTELGGFKVMVTGANGALTAQSVASLNITQINLTEDTTHIEMPGGTQVLPFAATPIDKYIDTSSHEKIVRHVRLTLLPH